MVGLPRESKISRPIISAMLVCILRGYDARCARAVQQMLRHNHSGERRLPAMRPEGRAEARPSEFGGKGLGADNAAPSNLQAGGTRAVVSQTLSGGLGY